MSSSVIRENTSTEKREFTIGGKSKYTCNTSIQLNLNAEDGRVLTTTIDRDYLVVENDLGTQYWVKSNKISNLEINQKLDARKSEYPEYSEFLESMNNMENRE